MRNLKRKINDYLITLWGEKQDAWDIPLNEFVYIHGIMQELKRDIKDNGIFTVDRYHQKKVNPALKTFAELYPKYSSLMGELGITPKAFAKLRGKDNGEEVDEYIMSLTGETKN